MEPPLSLSVPQPELNYEAISPGLATMEKPVEVRLASVHFPGGEVFGLEQLAGGKAGLYIFRQVAFGSPPDVWNASGKVWQPVSLAPLENLEAIPLIYQEGGPYPWQSLLVPAGQKDSAGQEVFQPSVSGYPSYQVQASFAGQITAADGTKQPAQGISVLSSAVTFIRLVDTARGGIEFGTDQTPQDATEVRLFLKNSAMQRIGMVEVRKVSGVSEIVIASFSGSGAANARVVLRDTGEIRLEPAAGQKVIIAGDLETEGIRYRPFGGGAKQDLV